MGSSPWCLSMLSMRVLAPPSIRSPFLRPMRRQCWMLTTWLETSVSACHWRFNRLCYRRMVEVVAKRSRAHTVVHNYLLMLDSQNGNLTALLLRWRLFLHSRAFIPHFLLHFHFFTDLLFYDFLLGGYLGQMDLWISEIVWHSPLLLKFVIFNLSVHIGLVHFSGVVNLGRVLPSIVISAALIRLVWKVWVAWLRQWWP